MLNSFRSRPLSVVVKVATIVSSRGVVALPIGKDSRCSILARRDWSLPPSTNLRLLRRSADADRGFQLKIIQSPLVGKALLRENLRRVSCNVLSSTTMSCLCAIPTVNTVNHRGGEDGRYPGLSFQTACPITINSPTPCRPVKADTARCHRN